MASRTSRATEWQPPGPTTPPPYQGPFDAAPPEGYTYFTQKATRTARARGHDHRGRERWDWDVTVYYTKVDDPLAPLTSVTHRISAADDLGETRIHRREYWKKSTRRSGWTSWSKVVEDRVEDIPLDDRERSETVDDENRMRAVKRRRRAEDLRRQEEARRAAEEVQLAEDEHRRLIEGHRRQYRETLRREAERERREQRQTAFERREASRGRAAERGQELRRTIGDRTSTEAGEIAGFAEAQTANALELVAHATEPAHLAEALHLAGQVQSVDHGDDRAQVVLERAAERQAGFIEDQIEVGLRRPADTSAAAHRHDARQLASRLADYQALGGSDATVEERAHTKLRRFEARARERQAQEDRQALNGRDQISDDRRGLGNRSRAHRGEIVVVE